MNRSVLIVTPYFAPQSHAAVFRAYKLAKYLPQYGWKPYVVTTDINYLYNEEQRLLDELPPEVEIHRARYIEPTLRGMYMALGGPDRTFKALKRNTHPSEDGKTTVTTFSPRPRMFGRLYQYLLETWLRTPDAHWTWEQPAVHVAAELGKRYQIPLVFTSADPYTSHRIGYTLQRRGIRWVADFRDPHTHSSRMHSSRNHVFTKQREAEQMAAQHADAVTVAAESIALILTETYGLNNTHPIHFIPTGLDENLIDINKESTSTLPSYPYLLFSGEFLPNYGGNFFYLFSQLLDNPRVAETGIKLLFVGRKDVNVPRVVPLLQQYGLEHHTEFIDHLPQKELYRYIQGATAALLIPGRRTHWWCLYAKLVDYIALQKPVIAIVPDPSEARTHLLRSGLGIFLDGDEASAIDQLRDFILESNCSLEVNEHYCAQFFAQEQLSAFVELFENVTA